VDWDCVELDDGVEVEVEVDVDVDVGVGAERVSACSAAMVDMEAELAMFA